MLEVERKVDVQKSVLDVESNQSVESMSGSVDKRMWWIDIRSVEAGVGRGEGDMVSESGEERIALRSGLSSGVV